MRKQGLVLGKQVLPYVALPNHWDLVDHDSWPVWMAMVDIVVVADIVADRMEMTALADPIAVAVVERMADFAVANIVVAAVMVGIAVAPLVIAVDMATIVGVADIVAPVEMARSYADMEPIQ